MKVAHIVKSLTGTSIPVEIASAINQIKGTRSDLIVLEHSHTSKPDTVSDDCLVFYVSDLASLTKLVVDEKYDVINFHHHVFSELSQEFLKILNQSPDRPKIVDSQHGHIHYTSVQKELNKVGLKFSDAIAFNSQTTADSYNEIERELMADKVQKVIRLGVDLEKINKYYQAEKVDNDIFTISIAARLIPRKNHQTLLRALARLTDTNFKLDIIGDGKLRGELEKQTKELGLHNNVIFHGYLENRSDVYKIIARSDVFVMPSYGEGFCVAVAEAMALGLPIITSDIKTLHEVLGKNGFYFDLDDADQLCTHIDYFYKNRSKAKEIGQKNRQGANENFDLSRTAQEYADLYKQLLD